MLKIPRPGRGKESARRSITQPIQPSRYRHDLTPREDVPAGTRAEIVTIVNGQYDQMRLDAVAEASQMHL